jgi:phage shock protein PspC (stress-responsive transcriptional regulator)
MLERTEPVSTKENPMATALVRPHDRVIAGVCSGLARRFGMSANTVRLLFVLSCILPGPQFLIYVALWVIMPSER